MALMNSVVHCNKHLDKGTSRAAFLRLANVKVSLRDDPSIHKRQTSAHLTLIASVVCTEKVNQPYL